MHSLMHSRMHTIDNSASAFVSLLQNVKSTGRKTTTPAKIEGHRSKFKPIGAAYISGLVVKKIKFADGSAISTAGAPEDAIGISDDLIMQFDTMMVPVSQFESSPTPKSTTSLTATTTTSSRVTFPL